LHRKDAHQEKMFKRGTQRLDETEKVAGRITSIWTVPQRRPCESEPVRKERCGVRGRNEKGPIGRGSRTGAVGKNRGPPT